VGRASNEWTDACAGKIQGGGRHRHGEAAKPGRSRRRAKKRSKGAEATRLVLDAGGECWGQACQGVEPVTAYPPPQSVYLEGCNVDVAASAGGPTGPARTSEGRNGHALSWREAS